MGLTTYAPLSSPVSPPPAQVVPESGDGAASLPPDFNDMIDAMFDEIRQPVSLIF